MFRSILVSSDFSPASWKAFQVGVSLKERYGSNLSVIHIFPAEDQINVTNDLKTRMERIHENMNKMSAEFNSEENSITNIVLPGNMEKELLNFVKEEKFDLVIMGVNGNGEDNLPGSHTTTILEKSTSPVLVIPNSFSLND